MSRFNVHYIDAAGKDFSEEMEAADQMSLYGVLKNEGKTLISASELKAGSKKSSIFSLSFGGKVKTHDKIIFARNLGAMLEAGLSAARALAVMEKQTRQKKFKSVIGAIGKSISQGKTLHESMAAFPDVFPQVMTSMTKAGEESGSLSQSLRIVSGQMENSYELSRKVRGAMMYPCVIICAMIGIGIFMLVYVVPILSATFKEMNATLPASTEAILGASDFVVSHIVLMALSLAVIIVIIIVGFRTQEGKRLKDFLFIHLPIIGPINKEVNAARTARTLSSLLSAGVDVVVAVKITGEVVQNSYYRAVLKKVEEKIQKGDPIATVFGENEKLYPPFVGEMISVGEETGQLSQMLLGVATFYENEVDQKTKDLSSIIEPVLMVVIGVVVGVFAVSIIGPIYSLGNNMN